MDLKETVLLRREQLGSDFRGDINPEVEDDGGEDENQDQDKEKEDKEDEPVVDGKADGKATAKAKAKAKAKATAKAKAKAKAKATAKAKAETKAKATAKAKAKAAAKGKGQERPRSNKAKDQGDNGGDDGENEPCHEVGEPNDKRRTFARRYVPSEGVAAIRFKAIQEVYEAEIGPALKRQSSYQEIGFELGALGLSGDMGFEYLCQRFKFISMDFFWGFEIPHAGWLLQALHAIHEDCGFLHRMPHDCPKFGP